MLNCCLIVNVLFLKYCFYIDILFLFNLFGILESEFFFDFVRFVFLLGLVFGDLFRDGDIDLDFVEGEYGFFSVYLELFDVDDGLVIIFLVGVIVVLDVRLLVGFVVGFVMGFGVDFELDFCFLFVLLVLFFVCFVFYFVIFLGFIYLLYFK